MPQRLTTDACLTEKQKKFFEVYSELQRFTINHPMPRLGYAPLSREAIDYSLLISELTRLENNGLTARTMTRFRKHHEISIFDYKNPLHLKLIIPEIVALNDACYLTYLSMEDYGRVIDKKSSITANWNQIIESNGLSDESRLAVAAGSFFIHKLDPFVALLQYFAGKKTIRKDDIDANPEYWGTPESKAHSRESFTEEASIQADIYYTQHHEAIVRNQATIISELQKAAQETGTNIHSLFQRLNTSSAIERAEDARVNTLSQESLYRGVLLNHMAEQIMQELPRTIETVTAHQQLQDILKNPHLSADAQARSFISFTTTVAPIRQREAGLNNLETLGQGAYEFAGELAKITKSKQIAQFAMGIQGFTQGFSGIRKLNKAIESFKTGGNGTQIASDIGKMFSAVSSVIGVFSMFMQGDEDGLSEALSEIASALQSMWNEMRQGFTQTWQLLEKMEENNAKRFCTTINYLEITLKEVVYSRFHLQASISRLYERVDQMSTELAGGIVDVLDQSCFHAIGELRRGQNRSGFIKENYPRLVTALHQYLVQYAANHLKSGYIEGPLSTSIILQKLQTPHRKKLGLLASLSNFYHPGFVKYPEQLIDDDHWVKVSHIYMQLVRCNGINAEAERAVLLKDIAAVRSKAIQVHQFLESCIKPETGKSLMDAIVAQFEANKTRARDCMVQVLENERRQINRNKLSHEGMTREEISAIESLNLLRLDETLEETSLRLASASAAYWQMPIDWSHWKFEFYSHFDVRNVLGANCTENMQKLVRNIPKKIIRFSHPFLSLFPNIDPPTIIEFETTCSNFTKLPFSLETNPLLNLSLRYGLIDKIGGGWCWYLTPGATDSSQLSKLIYTVRVNNHHIPIALAIYENSKFPIIQRNLVPVCEKNPFSYINRGGDIIGFDKIELLSLPVPRDTPITSIVTPSTQPLLIEPLMEESALIDCVKPDIMTIINSGCQQVSRALLSNETFLNAIDQMLQVQLFVAARSEQFGIKTNIKQIKNIKELLKQMDENPSVDIIKDILNYLGINQKRTLQAQQERAWQFFSTNLRHMELYHQMPEIDLELEKLEKEIKVLPVRPSTLTETPNATEPSMVMEELLTMRQENQRLHSQIGRMEAMMIQMQQLLISRPVQAAVNNSTGFNPQFFSASIPSDTINRPNVQAAYSVLEETGFRQG